MEKCLSGFFLLTSIFLIFFNIHHIDIVIGQTDGNISQDFGNLSNLNTIIELPLPMACVFDDGNNPRIDECDQIDNNGEMLGKDNIFFNLNSPRSFDTFTCTLQLQKGPVISSFPCDISSNVAEAQLESLDDGDYVFTVTAQRTVSDNNPLTPDAIEEAASPPFNFRVGIGGDGGGFDGDFGDTTFIEKSHFENLLVNEKLGFINLENKLKNDEITNITSLACLNSKMNQDTIFYLEFNCNRLLIFATVSPTSNFVSNTSKQSSPYLNDLYIYKVNNAISNGINGDLVSCGLSSIWGTSVEDGKRVSIDPVPCRDIFVAYEIPS